METAYQLDALLKKFEDHSMVAQRFQNKSISDALKKMEKHVALIEPVKDEYSERWTFWVEMPCGFLDSYLKESMADEEEEDEEELENIRTELKWEWESSYPEPVKWYQLVLQKTSYMVEFILSFDKYGILMQEGKELIGKDHLFKEQKKILVFLDKKLSEIINAILTDADKYNAMLESQLSKRNRVGRIRRQDYWDVVVEENRVDQELGAEKIQKLKESLPVIKEEHELDRMTADDFFRYCAIAYDANTKLPYDKKWTPLKKYKIHSDTRDAGLTEIDGSSEEAFRAWYESSRSGAHPWEICRGGSLTHILFRVSESDNKKWQLTLAGSSSVRVIETINMALALYEKKIPFCLAGAEEILRMVTGQDYIGLVPDNVSPRYCDELFPEEDRIIDFMDPWMESIEIFQPFIYWYPLVPYKKNG